MTNSYPDPLLPTAPPPSSPRGNRRVVSERAAVQIYGPMAIAGALLLFAVAAGLAILGNNDTNVFMLAGAVACAALGILLLVGLFIVQPNQAMVLVLFGRYTGTVKKDGFHWVNPLTRKRKISLRIHNFQTPVSKVNDAEGNPIEIAAVVVWRVVDTAKALFSVEDYDNYVAIQSETAIRSLAQEYPYDDFEGGRLSLRGNPDEVARTLSHELQARLLDAGVEVVEARLTHLAYATEIAEAMLRRQQASAVVAARQKIVEGAVGMVEDALSMLSEKDIVELDEERKATMVSNLLVVLCSETSTTPVVNAGSLY